MAFILLLFLASGSLSQLLYAVLTCSPVEFMSDWVLPEIRYNSPKSMKRNSNPSAYL